MNNLVDKKSEIERLINNNQLRISPDTRDTLHGAVNNIRLIQQQQLPNQTEVSAAIAAADAAIAAATDDIAVHAATDAANAARLGGKRSRRRGKKSKKSKRKGKKTKRGKKGKGRRSRR